jgi:sulfur carrier protein
MMVILPDGSRRELHISEDVIENILRDLKINPVEVVVAKNGTIVSELDRIGEEDEMRIIKITHGG